MNYEKDWFNFDVFLWFYSVLVDKNRYLETGNVSKFRVIVLSTEPNFKRNAGKQNESNFRFRFIRIKFIVLFKHASINLFIQP